MEEASMGIGQIKLFSNSTKSDFMYMVVWALHGAHYGVPEGGSNARWISFKVTDPWFKFYVVQNLKSG